jgi:predicted HD phosphohydrolase
MQPFTSADEAWGALDQQRGTTDGETLDLFEHGLQTAEGLLSAGCDDELVVAGLLHDLGDGRVSAAAHAPWAAALVRSLLGERVAWLIGAHAQAKRYLCAVEPAYTADLSPVSQRTLVEQGGVMTPEETSVFASHRWAADAVRLRRCDDAGKKTDYRVQEPERLRRVLERLVARG